MIIASGRVTHLPLRPEATSPDAVFTDMVDSWRRQQLSRNFRHETISGRERTIRRFADFTGHFPWEWTFADVEDYFAYTRSVSNLSQATVRAYQTNLKLFCDFLTDPAYDWSEVCGRSYGRPVTQIITDFNRSTHTQHNEQQATKRPFSRRELQDFFDLADVEVEVERVIFYGFEHTFVQQQVGHLHASTTSIYTAVSSDYQTRALNRVLERTINATTNSTPWEEKP
jgi:integrase